MARQSPTDDDVRVWTRATGSERETEALLATLHTLELQHAEWKRLLKTGLRAHQNELIEQDEEIRVYRCFESTLIPGLLQTPEYARARFTQASAVHRTPNDIDEAVRARMRRQDILYRSDKQFHFVLTEAALRYRLCSVDTILAQLDRLMSLSYLRNLRFGVIPFKTAYVGADPRHGFWILDRDRVRVETLSAELNLKQPQETELYRGIFEKLATVAHYGASARALIAEVVDDLASELPEDDS